MELLTAFYVVIISQPCLTLFFENIIVCINFINDTKYFDFAQNTLPIHPAPLEKSFQIKTVIFQKIKLNATN